MLGPPRRRRPRRIALDGVPWSCTRRPRLLPPEQAGGLREHRVRSRGPRRPWSSSCPTSRACSRSAGSTTTPRGCSAHQRRRAHAAAHPPEPRRGEDLPRRGRGRAVARASSRALRDGRRARRRPDRAGDASRSCSEHGTRARRSSSASTRAATARCGACATRSVIRCAGWCARASARCRRPLAAGRVAAAAAGRGARVCTRRPRTADDTAAGEQRPRTRRARETPANLARRETPGAARRDHVRRGLEGRDRRQDGAHGEGALRPQRAHARRRRQHHLHRHARPHRRVPGQRRRAPRSGSTTSRSRRPGAGRAARHAALRPGARALLHRPAPRRAAATCSSKARPRCGADLAGAD